MNFIVPVILIILSISEINKSLLVLRKNEKYVFLAFKVLMSIVFPFLSSKRISEIKKEYNKRIKSYATQSITFWVFVFIYNLVKLLIAVARKELF